MTFDVAPRMAIVAVALASWLMPSVSQARPGMHTLRVELNGAAVVLDQSDRFDFGGGGGLAYGLAPIPFLEIQAGYRAIFVRALEPVAGEPDFGAFHGLGLALVLHPLPSLDVGDLWIGAGGDVAFTGDVVRPAFNVRAGFDFEVASAFRLGPFAGFHYVLQTDQDLGPGDGAFVTFGLSMAFLGDDASDGVADTDGDGIPDGEDSCIRQPEDIDGFQDDDGCPDSDNDADGVEDEADACPDVAALAGRDQDRDGCTDDAVDSDGDGIADAADGCPDAAEDADGFNDEDGCPDPDNDGDGIDDGQDRCPDEPEVRNDFEDEDGCPDEAPEQQELTDISARILFPRGSDRPTRATSGAIAEVAQFLARHPEILEVRLEGHASATGDPDFNLRLSEQRAQRVRRMLIARGVDGSRLVIRAHGSSSASSSGAEADPAQDRRVTFTIVRRAD